MLSYHSEMKPKKTTADPFGIRAFLKAKGSGPAKVRRALGLKNAQNVTSWYTRGIPPSQIEGTAKHLGVTAQELISMCSQPEVVRGLLGHSEPGAMPTRADVSGKSNKELLRIIRAALDELERKL